jgi:hypothetical protein
MANTGALANKSHRRERNQRDVRPLTRQLVWANDDLLAPADVPRDLTGRKPDAHLVVVPDAGLTPTSISQTLVPQPSTGFLHQSEHQMARRAQQLDGRPEPDPGEPDRAAHRTQQQRPTERKT